MQISHTTCQIDRSTLKHTKNRREPNQKKMPLSGANSIWAAIGLIERWSQEAETGVLPSGCASLFSASSGFNRIFSANRGTGAEKSVEGCGDSVLRWHFDEQRFGFPVEFVGKPLCGAPKYRAERSRQGAPGRHAPLSP